MKFKQLAPNFSNTAIEEVGNIWKDMHLHSIVASLGQAAESLPDDLKEHLIGLLQTVGDLFSLDLPDLEADPDLTLKKVSRDVNLSRILKERAIFRLYRLVNERNDDGVLLFQELINPYTGSPYATQEEFIGWICEEAHLNRALIFQRLAAISRILTLGYDLDYAFKALLSHPYAVQETLRMIADWQKGDLVDVNPEVVMQIARKVAPESVAELEEMSHGDDMESRDLFIEASKPVFGMLLEEVASHDRSKDALNFVKHDVLMQPEISYFWDEELDVLMVEYIRKDIELKTHTEYIAEVVKVPFIPDTNSLPREVKEDLIRRLPIRGKGSRKA